MCRWSLGKNVKEKPLTLSDLINKVPAKKLNKHQIQHPAKSVGSEFWPVVVSNVWKDAADAFLSLGMDRSDFQIRMAGCLETDGVRHLCVVLHNPHVTVSSPFKIFLPPEQSVKWPLPRFRPNKITREELVKLSLQMLPDFERGIRAALHRIDVTEAKRRSQK